MFHVPYVALGAELSGDYHERNSVVAWRTVFLAACRVGVVTGLAYSGVSSRARAGCRSGPRAIRCSAGRWRPDRSSALDG